MICDRANQGNRERVVDMAKKVGAEGFQDMHLREIQELIDAMPEELREDNLMKMSPSEPVPDNEDLEAAAENKLTLDNPSEGF